MTAQQPKRSGFGRAMRLKQGRDFLRVKRLGRRLPCGCFVANWQVMPAGSSTRLGVITSKTLGNAVIRARARRLLREVFRLHQHEIAQPVDLVLVAQRGILKMDFAAVEKPFSSMLRQSGLAK